MQWLNGGNTRCSPIEATEVQEETSSEQSCEQHETCPICLLPISKIENYTKTKCGHMFCFSCINTSLMTNHTCPMCRTNIEDEPRQKENKKQLNMEDGVGMITEEIAYFDIKNHVKSAMYEIEQTPSLSIDEKIKKMTRNMKQMTRLYSMKLLQSFIDYENFDEDEEDDENEEAEDEPYETSEDEDEDEED